MDEPKLEEPELELFESDNHGSVVGDRAGAQPSQTQCLKADNKEARLKFIVVGDIYVINTMDTCFRAGCRIVSYLRK